MGVVAPHLGVGGDPPKMMVSVTNDGLVGWSHHSIDGPSLAVIVWNLQFSVGVSAKLRVLWEIHLAYKQYFA